MLVPPGEKIVENKKCRISGEDFIITDKDLEFYDKVSPIFSGKKYSIPSPTLCPDERTKRRMMFRNFRSLYTRKSSLSGKSIISMYHDQALFSVYTQNEWWSDAWSAFDYGQSFDSTKSFSEQLSSLHFSVPRICLNSKNVINSDYVNSAVNSKNCYLIFGCIDNEDCRYGHIVWKSKDCQDCLYVYECELCSSCTDCVNCHSVHYSMRAKNCTESYYLTDCDGCSSCFGCAGLKGKQYHIFNQPVEKELYHKRIQEIDFGNMHQMEIIQKQVQKNHDSAIFRCFEGIGNENIIGNNIYFSRDCFACFDIKNSEKLRYCATIDLFRDSYDCNFSGSQNELAYEALHLGGRHTLFSFTSLESSDILYCDQVYNSQNCFGCAGLKGQKNCVLNTSYSTHEYEELCGKIIDHMRSTGEWGEFFPHELSPFGYNESIANEYFPMLEEAVILRGWKWYEGENKNTYIGAHYSPLPIQQYNEKIVGFDLASKNINECLAGIIECKVTGKPFKIIKQELAYYIENGIPIPTKHPDQRHKERMDLRNPRKLYERSCMECQKEIITTYVPERPEKVVCEECYRKLVY